jgi:xanthine dehydrogenase accessory factor
MEESERNKTKVILIKGAGEKASAVAHRLHQSGFRKIIMTDLPAPRAERRKVCFCEALFDGQKRVCGVVCRKAEPSPSSVHQIWAEEKIPVLADPETMILQLIKPHILIDAVMARRNMGTSIHLAPLVIALGPGFEGGKDAHLVVETNPVSPDLGRAISEGQAEADTGIPTPVLGLSKERIIRAPEEGVLFSIKQLGDEVLKDETIGYVNSRRIKAPIRGCIWGLVRDGSVVRAGQKIGDIDPRMNRELCSEIAFEAQVIASGVLKAIMNFQQRQVA